MSTGYPATEATCRRIGIRFASWQADLNRCILAKDADGLFAADTVALSIARQVGKTFDVGGVVFADSIITPGTTTVWTAHRFKVARESFNELRAWARSPRLRQHIDYDDITTGAGNECIPFRNGSRVVFAARERGAIRGFTKVRRLVIDEGQILTEFALSDLAPTMNQAVNPQIIFMGTPPKPTDPSEVWMRLRTEALAGDSEGVLYVEISAAPGSDLDDRDAWREANPSYPRWTPEKAMLRLRKLLSPADFRREALGIWPDSESVAFAAAWATRTGAKGKPEGPVAFALSASWPDAEMGSIAVAAQNGPEVFTQIVDTAEHGLLYRPGTSWMPAVARELKDRNPKAVFVLDDKDPAAREKPALERAGIELIPLNLTQAGQAYGLFVSAVMGDQPYLRHYDQPCLNAAVVAAQKRPVGDAHTWARQGPDICCLVAATEAVYGLASGAAAKPPPDIF